MTFEQEALVFKPLPGGWFEATDPCGSEMWTCRPDGCFDYFCCELGERVDDPITQDNYADPCWYGNHPSHFCVGGKRRTSQLLQLCRYAHSKNLMNWPSPSEFVQSLIDQLTPEERRLVKP